MNLAADRNRTAKLISCMRQSQGLLNEPAALEEREFTGDKHKQSSAKYNFIAAIEAAIDLANHLISRNRLRAPEDYGDTFTVLAESGVLDNPFAAELVSMARFRNRLVHLYWDVDASQLHNPGNHSRATGNQPQHAQRTTMNCPKCGTALNGEANENERAKASKNSSDAFLSHPHPHSPSSPSDPGEINLIEYVYVPANQREVLATISCSRIW